MVILVAQFSPTKTSSSVRWQRFQAPASLLLRIAIGFWWSLSRRDFRVVEGCHRKVVNKKPLSLEPPRAVQTKEFAIAFFRIFPSRKDMRRKCGEHANNAFFANHAFLTLLAVCSPSRRVRCHEKLLPSPRRVLFSKTLRFFREASYSHSQPPHVHTHTTKGREDNLISFFRARTLPTSPARKIT